MHRYYKHTAPPSDSKKNTTYEDDPILVTAEVVADAEMPQQQKIPPTVAAIPSAAAAAKTTTVKNGDTTTTVKTYKIQAPNDGTIVKNATNGGGPITTYTHLGRNPTGLQCPYCQRQMVTVTKDVIGISTIVAIIIICFLCWPLFWLPLCIPSCKRTNHFCGHTTCQNKVGETKPCA